MEKEMEEGRKEEVMRHGRNEMINNRKKCEEGTKEEVMKEEGMNEMNNQKKWRKE